MAINFQTIKKELTEEQIIEIVCYLGAETYEKKGKAIVFPTICHNHRDSEKSMKLYYYPDTSLFRCYTECNESFDVFDLWQRVSRLDGHEESLFNIVDLIARKYNLNIDDFEDLLRYKQPIVIQATSQPFYEYKVIDKKILGYFSKRRIGIWEKEKITVEAMRQYDIGFYEYGNKIIIPHFNVDGNLIGIRVRNLEEEDLIQGKYMPAVIENTMYSHPLSFNLYGLNISKGNINKHKIAYVFEGEKSCLKMASYYPDDNVSVAACGSNLNKFQIMLLKKYCGVNEIVICFDRQFETSTEEEKYFNKLYEICERYNNYCTMSFVFDDGRLLGYKDAPIDGSKETFEKLISERRFIRSSR